MSETFKEAVTADAKSVPVKTDPFPLDHELQGGSEFRDLLLDILNKQDVSDIQVTERDGLDGYHGGANAKDATDTLTLYATNDEDSAEPSRAIQINTDQVNRIYSTYFTTKEDDKISSKSCLDNNKEQNQIKVKSCYSPIINLKAAQDSSLSQESSTQVEGADISLNSSGYTSANSPVVSNDPSYTTSPPESTNVVRTVTPDPLSIHSPKLSNILISDEIPSINQSTQSKEVTKSEVNLSSRISTEQVNPSSQLRIVNMTPPDPPLNPSPVPSYSNSNPYNVPAWLSHLYPELYQAWENNSGRDYYQGGVLLHCSVCSNPSSGFHDNLPLCETHRVGKACAVCRLRLAAGFSYGLALCEADRIFLFKLFVKPPRLQRCPTLCPVTVQQWCPYCRLRTCLATKGFRFSSMTPDLENKVIPDRNARKRKYSGSTKDISQSASRIKAFDVPITTFRSNIVAKSSITSGPMVHQAEKMTTWVHMSNLNQPPKFVQPSFKLMPGLSKVASFQAENPPFRGSPQLDGDSIPSEQQVQTNPENFKVDHNSSSSLHIQHGRVAKINQQQLRTSELIRCPSLMQPSSVPSPTTQIMYPTQVHANNERLHHGGQNVPVLTSSYFNGALLGSSIKSISKRDGVLTDRINHSWVKEQQEKYLRYHMKLFQLRKK